MQFQMKFETPMQRFPVPDTPAEDYTMSTSDWRLSPKAFQKKRERALIALNNFLPNRPVFIVGVTKKIQVADGTEQGAMQPGRGYQLGRDDFIKLKMDPERSPFLVCLEPKTPCMYFEVCRAINILWPQVARNTYLSVQ